MKKVFKIVFFIIFMSFIMTVSLSSCKHKHSFKSEWSSNETHHWHNASCRHKKVKSTYEEHKFDQEIKEEKYLKELANCSHGAIYFKSCICGAKGTETFFENEALPHEFGDATYEWNEEFTKCIAKVVCKNDLSHVVSETVDVTKTIIQEQTCEKEEISNLISADFTNPLFQKQVKNNEVTKPKKGHVNVTYLNKVDAKCTEDGFSGDVYCNDCEKVVETGHVVEALGHKEELRNFVASTYDNEGYSGDVHCERCGILFETGSITPLLGLISEEKALSLFKKDYDLTVFGKNLIFYSNSSFSSNKTYYNATDGSIYTYYTYKDGYVYHSESLISKIDSNSYKYGYVSYDSVGRPNSAMYEIIDKYQRDSYLYELLSFNSTFNEISYEAFNGLDMAEYVLGNEALKVKGQIREDGNTYITINCKYPRSGDAFNYIKDNSNYTIIDSFEDIVIKMVVDKDENFISFEASVLNEGTETFYIDYYYEFANKPSSFVEINFDTLKPTADEINIDGSSVYITYPSDDLMYLDGLLPQGEEFEEFISSIDAQFVGLEPGSTFNVSFSKETLESFLPSDLFDVRLALYVSGEYGNSYALGELGTPFVVPTVSSDASFYLEYLITPDLSKFESKKFTLNVGDDTYYFYDNQVGIQSLSYFKLQFNYLLHNEYYKQDLGFSTSENGEILPDTAVINAGTVLYPVYENYKTLTIYGIDDYVINIPIHEQYVCYTKISDQLYFEGIYNPGYQYKFLGYYTSPSFNEESKVSMSNGYFLVDKTKDNVWFAKTSRSNFVDFYEPIVCGDQPLVDFSDEVEKVIDNIIVYGFDAYLDNITSLLQNHINNEYNYESSKEITIEGIYIDEEFTTLFDSFDQITTDKDFKLYIKLETSFITLSKELCDSFNREDVLLTLDMLLYAYDQFVFNSLGSQVSYIDFATLFFASFYNLGLGMQIEGFYLDKELTIPMTEIKVENIKLYPKIVNSPVVEFDNTLLPLSEGKAEKTDLYSLMMTINPLKCLEFNLFKYELMKTYWQLEPSIEIEDIYTDEQCTKPLVEFPNSDVKLYIKTRDIQMVFLDETKCEWAPGSFIKLSDLREITTLRGKALQDYLISSGFVRIKSEFEEGKKIEGIYFDQAFTQPFNEYPTKTSTLFVNIVDEIRISVDYSNEFVSRKENGDLSLEELEYGYNVELALGGYDKNKIDFYDYVKLCMMFRFCSVSSDKFIIDFYLDSELNTPFNDKPSESIVLYPKVVDNINVTFDTTLCSSSDPNTNVFPLRYICLYDYMGLVDFDLFKLQLKEKWVCPEDKMIDKIYTDEECTTELVDYPVEDVTLYVTLKDEIRITINEEDADYIAYRSSSFTLDYFYSEYYYLTNSDFEKFKYAILSMFDYDERNYLPSEIFIDDECTKPLTEIPTESVTLYFTWEPVELITFDETYCILTFGNKMAIQFFNSMPVSSTDSISTFLIKSNFLQLKEEFEVEYEIKGLYLDPFYTKELTEWPSETVTVYVKIGHIIKEYLFS